MYITHASNGTELPSQDNKGLTLISQGDAERTTKPQSMDEIPKGKVLLAEGYSWDRQYTALAVCPDMEEVKWVSKNPVAGIRWYLVDESLVEFNKQKQQDG